MGYNPVIDRSPIDQYGSQQQASSLAHYGATAMQRGNELWDMGSSRNQMFKRQQMEDAFDVQANQQMMSQRQAARSGQAFQPGGMDTSGAVRAQVQKNWMSQMMAQQAQSGSFLGQAGGMASQAGGLKSSLNQMYRQQQQVNQQARNQARQYNAQERAQEKAAKMSMIAGIGGAMLGPALGAVGGGLAGMVKGQGFMAGATGGPSAMPQTSSFQPSAIPQFQFNPQQSFGNYNFLGNNQ